MSKDSGADGCHNGHGTTIPQVLTARQIQVMDLLVADVPRKEICRKLGITKKTVYVHLNCVCERVGTGGVIGAVVWYVREMERAKLPVDTARIVA